MTKSKSLISIFMAVAMLLAFSVPSFAAEVEVNDFNPEVHFTPADESESVVPMAPGLAGIYSVTATPYNSTTGKQGYSTTSYGNGRTSYVHVTLDDYARQTYDQINADSYMVDIYFNLTGVTRYELFLNGELYDSGRVAVSSGYIDFKIKDERPAIWQVNLYDNTSTGKATWGHINYK